MLWPEKKLKSYRAKKVQRLFLSFVFIFVFFPAVFAHAESTGASTNAHKTREEIVVSSGTDSPVNLRGYGTIKISSSEDALIIVETSAELKKTISIQVNKGAVYFAKSKTADQPLSGIALELGGKIGIDLSNQSRLSIVFTKKQVLRIKAAGDPKHIHAWIKNAGGKNEEITLTSPGSLNFNRAEGVESNLLPSPDDIFVPNPVAEIKPPRKVIKPTQKIASKPLKKYSPPVQTVAISPVERVPVTPLNLAPEKIATVVEAKPAQKIVVTEATKPVMPSKELGSSPDSAKYALNPYYAFTSLATQDKATTSKSAISTNLRAGLDALYFQNWDTVSQSFIHLNVGFVKFEAPAIAGQSLDNAKRVLTTFGIGHELFLSKRFNFLIKADLGKELFTRATSTTSATVDSAAIPSLTTRFAYNLVEGSPYYFGFAGLYAVNGAGKTAGYKIQMGSSRGLSVYFMQDVGGGVQNLTTEITYLVRRQDTTIVHQADTTVLLQMNLKFPFGSNLRSGEK